MNEKDTVLSLTEVLASLSYALDLTTGQSMGHAQRACLIAMRIGSDVGLPQEDLSSLYHAMLLKDSGCSSNAARMYEIFGCDELQAKRASKITDWSNLAEALKYAAAHALPEGSILARARRFLTIAAHPTEAGDGLMEARCTRGAEIARSVGLGAAAAECIQTLDEHWDGHGAPQHLRGDQIPILGRIACLAQTLEVFATTFGVDAAFEVARKRAGKWFDPQLVRAAQHLWRDDAFWQDARENSRSILLNLQVRAAVETAGEERIDAVCDSFAQIVDAKSHFTGQHSLSVSRYAVEIARSLGLSERRQLLLRRAGLLHDLGKLAVPNSILDKPGKPTEEEWECIKRHPYYTQQILAQISGFERLTEIAAAHHERLDGRGYFRGLSAAHLDLDMRILAVADVFDALAAERPYRAALPPERVFAILDKDAGVALDGDCIACLKEKYLWPEMRLAA